MLTLAENPLREGLEIAREPDRCTIVIFGATGDLTRRKLVPALFSLAADGLLPARWSIVGAARTPLSDEEFRAEMQRGVAEFSRRAGAMSTAWENFASNLFYQRADDATPSSYADLHVRLEAIARERDTGPNRIFYLATPPASYSSIATHLSEAGAMHPSGTTQPWSRLIVEKPFGRDLTSARLLNTELGRVFAEDQIYRIDHYLGKETVQNILVLRFANGVFEPVWNRRYVDHVQITVAESIGIEGRAAYFDHAGILRDIVQNHMLQLLAMTAMEPPVTFDAEAVRDEKVKVLRALRPLTGEDVSHHVVRGQYGEGSVHGGPAPAYRDEKGVDPRSFVETFVALEMYVDSWRWAGVPFYLRAGKRLPKRVTEIAITFRQAPLAIFSRAGAPMPGPSVLALRIQPDEGITLKFGAKVPGPSIRIQSVNMDFRYGASFGETPPEAYERLLLDAMLGDSTLYTRRDEVEAAWEYVTGILEGWAEAERPALALYPAGTWGPPEADALLSRSSRAWRRL